MIISQMGVDLVKHFEGLYLEAYFCPAGVLTIGFGTTGSVDGVPIDEGMKITKDKAEELLRKDLEEFSSGVSKLLKFVVAQHEFDALVSLAYNIGISAFKRSTLLKLLNGKNFTDAAEQFLKWNKAKGKVLAGLKRRRQAERHLFLTGTLKFNFA